MKERRRNARMKSWGLGEKGPLETLVREDL